MEHDNHWFDHHDPGRADCFLSIVTPGIQKDILCLLQAFNVQHYHVLNVI